MLDLKWGVLMAGIVVDMKTWKKIPKNYHSKLISIADDIQKKYSELNNNADEQALNAMKEYGLQVHSINDEEKKLWFMVGSKRLELTGLFQ